MPFGRSPRSSILALMLAASPLAGAHAETAAVPPAAVDAAATVEIQGFRSARFGMDAAAVRKAAAADFGIDRSKLVASTNPAERTDILTARVAGVLEGGGAADVSYVFGYKSKKLTQVSVLWSSETDAGTGADRLVANANVLRSYFLTAGYKPDTIVTDVPVPEGLLMFRGTDAKGRMAVLLLRGTFSTPAAPAKAGGAPAQPASPVLTPTSLLLAYIENPQNPDVFAVKPGQF